MGVLTSFLEREYASSPVPVLERSNSGWRKICKSKGIAFGSGYGGYYPHINLPDMPGGLIVIDDQLPNFKRLAVFYHESTHAECRNRGCECFTAIGQSQGVCEHHAQLGALLKCVKANRRDSLEFTMRHAANLSVPSLQGEPNLGARMTINHPYWDECRQIVGEDVYRSLVYWHDAPTTVRLAA